MTTKKKVYEQIKKMIYTIINNKKIYEQNYN